MNIRHSKAESPNAIQVKDVWFMRLDNESVYRFRLNYSTKRKKALTTKEKRQLLAQSLRDALAFVEGDSEIVETGFQGFGRANVWMEGA